MHIDPQLQRVLDGELPSDDLGPLQREQFDALQRAARLLAEAPVGSVAARVMAEVRRPPERLGQRVARWLTERHAVTIAVRPIWSLALAAALAAIAVIPSRGPGPVLGEREGIAQFVGRFPGARSVEVVGSFTDWRPGAVVLRDDDHDGIWRASVVLPVGEHEYMFVVDGERWITDPLAGRYVDDGFGRENALIFVRPLSR
ncbi:MAG TPA: isoamylase early set domain-containing protein [Gemmatimonadales bacterium]